MPGLLYAAVLWSWLRTVLCLEICALSLIGACLTGFAGALQFSCAVPGLPTLYPPLLGFHEASFADSAGACSLESAFVADSAGVCSLESASFLGFLTIDSFAVGRCVCVCV